MPIIETKGCQCVQCKHIWIPGEWRRTSDYPLPRWCPKCKSARWNEGELVEQPIVKRNVVKQRKVKPKVEQSPADESPIMLESTAKGLDDYKPLREGPGREGKCPHHKQRGELCYKCDHQFGIPAIKTGK